MYLSLIQVDIGTGSGRPRPGWLWLRNLYRVHQRLCMAFPSESRKETDPHFLSSYQPEDFPETKHQADLAEGAVERAVLDRVHSPRDTHSGFLFRIEPSAGSRAAILVQSAKEPNWDYAFHNAPNILAATPQLKQIEPHFEPSQCLRFRLLANPVRKVSKKSLDARGEAFAERWIGKEVPVPPGDLRRWLERRSEPDWASTKHSEKEVPPGFRLVSIAQIQSGCYYVNKNGQGSGGRRVRFAQYDGILEVTDVASFSLTLTRGIGPAKAFGFGLLSVAPVR